MSNAPQIPLTNAQILQELADTLEQLGITQKVGLASIDALFFDPRNPHMINNDILLESAFLGNQVSKDFLVNQAFNIPDALKETQIQAQAFAGLNANQLHLDTAPGVSLEAWYIKPEPGKSTILFSNGADGDFIKSEELMAQLKGQGYGILAYQFRGYGAGQGGSTGSPSEQGLNSDLKALSQLLAEGSVKDGIVKTPYSRQVLMGYSLGADVSAHLAAGSTNHYKSLVMIDAPKSLEDAFKAEIQDTDPLARQITSPFQANINAVEQKLSGAFDITQDVAHLHTPTLFVEGGQDMLALPNIEQALFNSDKDRAKSYFSLSLADHNTILSDKHNADVVEQTINNFLSPSDCNRVIQDMTAYCAKNDSGPLSDCSANQHNQIPLVLGSHHK